MQPGDLRESVTYDLRKFVTYDLKKICDLRPLADLRLVTSSRSVTCGLLLVIFGFHSNIPYPASFSLKRVLFLAGKNFGSLHRPIASTVTKSSLDWSGLVSCVHVIHVFHFSYFSLHYSYPFHRCGDDIVWCIIRGIDLHETFRLSIFTVTLYRMISPNN